jgi:hypothetical protein
MYRRNIMRSSWSIGSMGINVSQNILHPSSGFHSEDGSCIGTNVSEKHNVSILKFLTWRWRQYRHKCFAEYTTHFIRIPGWIWRQCVLTLRSKCCLHLQDTTLNMEAARYHGGVRTQEQQHTNIRYVNQVITTKTPLATTVWPFTYWVWLKARRSSPNFRKSIFHEIYNSSWKKTYFRVQEECWVPYGRVGPFAPSGDTAGPLWKTGPSHWTPLSRLNPSKPSG